MDGYEALLSDDERARRDRLGCARARDEFLAKRALVRAVLSNYADVAPAEWLFTTEAGGKPATVAPSIPFNLTNTRGLVAMIVGGVQRLGLDAERIEPRDDLALVALRFFTAHEACMASDTSKLYANLTLKESYLKARGAGLGLPLDGFSFELAPDQEPRVAFTTVAYEAARWQFGLLRASPEHVLAVSVDTGGEPLELRAARVVPLHGIVPF